MLLLLLFKVVTMEMHQPLEITLLVGKKDQFLHLATHGFTKYSNRNTN